MSQSWVKWFLSTPRGKYFVQIDDEYLQNIYNYYGLRQKVPNFKYALDLIQGPFIPPQNRPAAWPDDIDDYGLCLYGLIHARYLLTDEGQKKMFEKFKNNEFPHCPRVFCKGITGLPYGSSDDIGQSNLKIFCPNCNDIYSTNDDTCNQMDGAFFGPNWVHLFIQRYPDIVPKETPTKYIPRIFGMRIASS